MKNSLPLSLSCFLALYVVTPSISAEFHVLPKGVSTGDGSIQNAWDLATALAHPAAVKPGDTIWLHGGVYRGGFRSELKGKPSAPIIVRQYPGERAIIDTHNPNKKGDPAFYLLGAWARYQGFEVKCSDPKRVTKIKGSWPKDIQRGSVEVRGSHIQCINLLVHDLGNGYGFWADGGKGKLYKGGEIYGCLIYHNGWSGPDRGHGHAVYAQNKAGIKRIEDNIIFNQFGDGIDVYGSSRATLRGFRIEGNISFNNGCVHLNPKRRTYNILTGGEAPLDDVEVRANATYGGLLQIGYPWGKRNGRVEVKENYLAGGARMFFQEKLTFTDNTVLFADPLNSIYLAKNVGADKLTLNGNTYYQHAKQPHRFAFYVGGKGGSKTMADWRALGFDKDSKLPKGMPPTPKVIIRPNKYEHGRANIAVYNWEKKPSVEIDLHGVLKKGQRFRIVSAQNFHGPAVASGVFDGRPISLSMKPAKPAQPIGMPDYRLPVTEPEFGAFVLLPVRN